MLPVCSWRVVHGSPRRLGKEGSLAKAGSSSSRWVRHRPPAPPSLATAGTNYIETLRVQVHANCRIRRIYFSGEQLHVAPSSTVGRAPSYDPRTEMRLALTCTAAMSSVPIHAQTACTAKRSSHLSSSCSCPWRATGSLLPVPCQPTPARLCYSTPPPPPPQQARTLSGRCQRAPSSCSCRCSLPFTPAHVGRPNGAQMRTGLSPAERVEGLLCLLMRATHPPRGKAPPRRGRRSASACRPTVAAGKRVRTAGGTAPGVPIRHSLRRSGAHDARAPALPPAM